jgi:hypothetical protein
MNAQAASSTSTSGSEKAPTDGSGVAKDNTPGTSDTASSAPSSSAAGASTGKSGGTSGATEAGVIPKDSGAAAVTPSGTDASTQKNKTTATKKTLKEEIEEIDADRSKVIGLVAQEMELILPLPQLQQQVAVLERLAGRTNPNVVLLYNIITTFHYRRAFANGQYNEGAKMCLWMLDTEQAAQKGLDEFLVAHTQIQLADLYRQLGRNKDSLQLLEKSIPMLNRSKTAMKKLETDFKTMEGPVDRERRQKAGAEVKQKMADKQKYIDVLQKQLAKTRYAATEIGDLYFMVASDYLKLGNEAKAAEYLALAKSKGLAMIDKTKSIDKPVNSGTSAKTKTGNSPKKPAAKR